MSYLPGICTFCGTGCGHLLDIRDGQVRGVFPLQNHPVSKGRLCVRGWHVHELLNTPQRIATPLVRTEGRLAETSYDQALGLLAGKLLALGRERPDAIGFLGSPRSSNEENYLLMKLARAVFGTNHVSLDSEPGHRTTLDVLHQGTGMAGMLGSLQEIAKAQLILVAGIDITKQNPIIGSEIHKAGRAGSKVVTIDTRNTQIARLSGRFLQVRPGSFKVAMAAMAKALTDEDRCDRPFLARHAEGLEALVPALAPLTDADVAAKTGVPVEQLKEVARDLAAARSAMVFFSSGISGFDRETVAAIYDLFLLAGKVGKEGCGVNPITGINNLQGSYDMGVAPDLLTGFQPLSDRGVLERFGEAWGVTLDGEPGRPIDDLLASGGTLRALVVVDHDETLFRHADALARLELVAYLGAFTNPFLDHAHVVLPIAAWAEFDGTYTNTERRVQLASKRLEPVHGVLPGWQLISAIAERAGARWRYDSAADVMAEIARLTPAYAGITHERLRGRFGIQWPCDARCPDGTARLAVDGPQARLRFAPLSPDYRTPPVTEEYPTLLLVGEAQHYWHQNNLMRKTHIPRREYDATLLQYPRGYVAISPEHARELKVRDGAMVRIASPYGAMEAMVRVSDAMRMDTAYVACFVSDMVDDFLLAHRDLLRRGEDAAIAVRMVKL